MNPRYPFGVYTISNRARSASYATSPCVGFVASPVIIQHPSEFVNPYFYILRKNSGFIYQWIFLSKYAEEDWKNPDNVVYYKKINHGGDVVKVRILIAIVLVLLIAEFAFLANRLPADYEAAALQAQQQQEDIRQRTEQLEAKQEFLSTSKSDKAIALEEEADRVRMEAASLLAEMANIRAGEEDIKMQLTQLQEEFSDVEEQYNYYVEVCNELKKGIETVKAYIAGN